MEKWRVGKIDGSALSICRCEIEAKEKLLMYADIYHLTEDEIEVTKQLLEDDRKALRKLNGEM